MKLIEARGITLRRDGRVVLDSVDLDVSAGEIVTIVGPNGSGKTTLLRVLIGALRPDAGMVWRAPGLRIGHVPQRLRLESRLPMTVSRLLRLAGAQRGQEDALLARVGMAGFGERQIAELSGGQLQRVLTAQALACDPQLLILDEPTQGLDQPGEAAFYEMLATLRDETGMAVLMVSHDLHVVMSASDRVICLNHHVCCHGSPAVVSAAPEYRALFGPGTRGALALYRHEHDHRHDHDGTDHHPHHHHDHPADERVPR